MSYFACASFATPKTFFLSPRPGKKKKSWIIFMHPIFFPFCLPSALSSSPKVGSHSSGSSFSTFQFLDSTFHYAWAKPAFSLVFFFYCCSHFHPTCDHGHSSKLAFSGFSTCHLNFHAPPAVYFLWNCSSFLTCYIMPFCHLHFIRICLTPARLGVSEP